MASPLAPLVRVRLIGKGGIQGVRGDVPPETAAMSYENSREKKVSMLRFFLTKVEI